jgi:hypothetical protein
MSSWFEFLRIDADLAMTFIVSARLHSNAASSACSLGNARRALAEIRRRLENPAGCYLSGSEALFLERRCRKIESAIRDS